MKKYVGLSFILVLGFSFLIGAFPVRADEYTEAGSWRSTGAEREIFYNVSESGDDVYLRVGSGFSSTSTAQPLRHSTYDIIGALVFDIPDRVYNATHRESPSLAWLEVYSGDTTMLPTGRMTFYQINASVIGPYTNYTELYEAPYPYHVGNVPMLEFGRGSEPLGWEGWRGASLRSLENAVNRINNPFYASMDNNSLGLKYLTSAGPHQHFLTYDDNASRAPRIGVVWEMQEWLNVTAPGGYTGDDYERDYRGFHLWGSTADAWFNFSTFTITGSDSGVISGLNDTYFHVNQLKGHHQIWMQRDFEDDGTGLVNRRFGIRFTDLQAGGGPSYNWYGMWGLSDTSNTWVYGWGEGYTFAGRTFDDNPKWIMGNAWDIENGVLGDNGNWFYSLNFTDSRTPFTLWFDIYLNMNTASYQSDVYNDFDMTDLNHTYTKVFDDAPPVYSLGAFPYETLVNGWQNLVSQMGYTGDYLSGPNVESFIATDDNGTLLSDIYPDTIDPGYDDIDDLKADIDRLFKGLDPSYDALPNLGSTIMLLMGVLGVIAIPGGFIVMGMSIRSGNWEEGFYYLLVMFFVGLAFVTAWLFG